MKILLLKNKPVGTNIEYTSNAPLGFKIARLIEKKMSLLVFNEELYSFNGRSWVSEKDSPLLAENIRTIIMKLTSGQSVDGVGVTEDEIKVLSKFDGQTTDKLTKTVKQILGYLYTNPANKRTENPFDRDPFIINAHNATINMRDPDLIPQYANDFGRMITKADYLPLPDTPPQAAKEYCSCIAGIFNGKEYVVASFHSILASTLIGGNKPKKLIIFFGPTEVLNMIYEMIRNTVGDYAGNINAEAVIKKRYNEDLRKEVCAVKDRRIILVTGFRNNCIYDAQLLTWLASYTEIQLKEGASRLINFRFEGTILMFAEQIPEFSQYDNNFLRN